MSKVIIDCPWDGGPCALDRCEPGYCVYLRKGATPAAVLEEASDCGDPIARVLSDVYDELKRANEKFPNFNSAHEGRSVIDEEFWELTEHVFGDTGYTDDAYAEAKQLAAMAAKYMLMVRSRQEQGRAAEKGTR